MHDPKSAIDFLKSNPIGFFWIAGSISSAAVVSCIFAYLSVFDKSLIWLIELNDILKTSVIFAGAVIFFIFSNYLYMTIGKKENRENKVLLMTAIIFGVLYVVTAALQIFLASDKSRIHIVWFYVTFGFCIISFLDVLNLMKAARWQYEDLGLFSTSDIATLSYRILFFCIFVSLTYGNFVRYVSKHELSVEFVKNGQEVSVLNNATIVAMLQNHCVVLSNNYFYVVKTSDIISITDSK